MNNPIDVNQPRNMKTKDSLFESEFDSSVSTTGLQNKVGDDIVKNKIVEKINDKFQGNYQRVLLINPPQFPEELLNIKIVKNKRYYNYPPYGLGLLGSNLKRRGYTFDILDLNLELLSFINEEDNEKIIKSRISCIWKEKIDAIVKSFRPDIVGICCMFTMSHDRTIETSDYIKFNWPELRIIAGGVHITNAPDYVLQKARGIDFLSLYESDQSFCNFLDYVNGKVPEENLTQIGTLIDGEYVSLKNRDIPPPESMDIFPDYANLPVGKYNCFGEVGNFRFWEAPDVRISSVLSNRGCRAHCSFCSVANFNGKGVRARSVNSVLDEIERLKDDHGVNHITWLDDDLFYNPQRTVELFNGIVKRKLGITWDAMNGIIASAVAAHPETMDAAAESGCIAVNYGVESGNEEILRSIHKPSGVKHYLKVGEIMRKYPQIYSRNFLIIGFPNETFKQMLDTVQLVEAMGCDWNGVQKLTPLPNTEIYDQMIDEGLIKKDKVMGSEEYSGFLIRETEKQRLQEKDQKLKASTFVDYFKENLDAVPTQKELNDVWLLMDYKVNYQKILTEEEPLRLKKMERFLTDVSTRMTVDNPLSTLFLAVVKHKLGDLSTARYYSSKSKDYLQNSAYWQERFRILDIDYLYDLSESSNYLKTKPLT